MVVPMAEAEAFLVLLALGALCLLVLALSAWLAARAKRAPVVKPAKKTFEHGRRIARLKRATTVEAALAALRDPPVGRVLSLRGDERNAEVVMERKRGQPCPQAAGYLAGLFEMAWAHDVLVTHPQCGGDQGGVCHYVVHRAATVSGAPGAGASTRGSADARHRSPRARAGGP